MTAEHSMGWLEFRGAMAPYASSLNSSNCPMVFVLPDGKEVRFDDVEIDLVPITLRRGDAEYPAYEYHVKLIKQEAAT